MQTGAVQGKSYQNLKDPDIVFARKAANFVAHFQFEEGGEDLRTGELGVESLDQFIDVNGLVGFDSGEDLLLLSREFGGGGLGIK